MAKKTLTAPKIAAFALVMRLLIGGLEDLSDSWQDMLIQPARTCQLRPGAQRMLRVC